MKHRIDPTIDCVFKQLLGTPQNRNLLISFINAFLESELEHPITDVDILNPYNEKEFTNDKLSIVDVKAMDDKGCTFQIEVQVDVFSSLPARMLYTWSDIYSKQIQSGDSYHELRPTYSIWLLNKSLVRDERYIRSYHMQDDRGNDLVHHGGIWLLELGKFSVGSISNEKDRWLAFFKQGEMLDDSELPSWMNTDNMRQAMKTLRQFSEKQKQYDIYQARQNYLRVQNSINRDKEDALKAKEEALKNKDEALKAKEEALKAKDEALKGLANALQREEIERKEKELERQEKESALHEIARLKEQLSKQSQ